MGLIISEIREGLGIITLNNAEKRNCLSHAMIEEFLIALDEFEKQKVWVVLIKAVEGSVVWSAGHDVNELPEPGKDPLPYGGHFEKMLHRIQDYPGPVIAMVNGSVWGGGCDLVCCCDIAVGSQHSSFAMTPAKLGIPYNPSGLIHFLNKISLNMVQEMFYTAEPISAYDAFYNGVLNHVVASERLEEFALDIAHKILRNAPLAVWALKQQFRLLTKGIPIDAETAEKIQAIRRTVFTSEDYKESLQAFKDKRKPNFKGY